MRAVRFHEHGGPDQLRVGDIDRPDPGADEVLVEVDGAGVNPVDTYIREGATEPFTLPMIPGIDVAGTAAVVGQDVTDIDVGDPVYGTGIGKNHYGGYAEFVAVPDDRLVTLPSNVDMVAAGAAGVVSVTAWRALVDHANLQATDVCLIHGGSGGVGHAAVQIAATSGARVITTANPSYHDELYELGADTVLDYARDDLASAVQAAGGGGVDVVLDHRLDEYLQFDATVANVGCRIIGIGENETGAGFDRSSETRRKDLQLTMMTMFNTPDLRVPLRKIAYLLSEGDVEIQLAETYELEEAAAAQRRVIEDSFFGKVVLTP
ncbi:NADPH:quinone reductase [Natronorubrum sp. FCH18a]|uniref:NADPH:quinone reductase n=1 Tax=Natronorubrum sp. FCH18a TaxID=3447018 RepID=UPI003F511D24